MTTKSIGKIIFGNFEIPSSQIFLLRTHVYAMINIRPLTPGHVLVVTRRSVPKLSSLTETETLELWCTAQEVSQTLEQIYKVNLIMQKCCKVTVQDGMASGQTVPHVHIHIFPHEGDLVEVDIEKENRTAEDMGKEAAIYRPYFDQLQPI